MSLSINNILYSVWHTVYYKYDSLSSYRVFAKTLKTLRKRQKQIMNRPCPKEMTVEWRRELEATDSLILLVIP